MPDLGDDDLPRGEGDGLRRARYAEDRPAVDDACYRPGEDRSGPDLLVTFEAEEFAEPVDGLLKQRRDRLDGHVVGREPGAPGDDDTGCTRKGRGDFGADPREIIGDHGIVGHLDAVGGEEVDERLSAGVSPGFPARRDGYDGPGHGEGFKMVTLHRIFQYPCTAYFTSFYLLSDGVQSPTPLFRLEPVEGPGEEREDGREGGGGGGQSPGGDAGSPEGVNRES